MSQEDCGCPQRESLPLPNPVTSRGGSILPDQSQSCKAACTPDGRGQGHLPPTPWTERDYDKGRGEVP